MSAMDLSKMGTAKVVLNTSDCNHIVIEKWPVSDVEWAFYLYAATELNQAGIATPTLFSADAALRQLKLEYIPYKVDQTAVANDYAIAMLGRLHRYPANSEWLYHTHTWTETALENALMLLALPELNVRQLRRFQQNSNALFACQSLVSGDSNAGNWGRRENGNLVLFDWERFGKGSPAIDLAPLIRGMGTKQEFIDLAERYCQLSSHQNIRELAREIAVVKAWIVTEVIVLLHMRRKSTFPLYLNWYREHLPAWLDNVEKML
ncbi:TPA: phosphotransferase [Enterobacter hormaechei]|nr:phosphotransferase [Enterobacter hormaechei]HBL5006633.1 phosphotransferase [Enterobacter hormaechei]HBL8894667.1 phosphotransferase [Enterobacter hormaechei]HDV8228953.1 phosphotransferase [Enterobacter hormaechei]